LNESLNRVTRKYTSQEVEEKLLAAQVPCARVRSIGDIIEEPHMKSRGLLEETDYPGLGRISTVKTPIFFPGNSSPNSRRAPLLGEHSTQILKELGFLDEEIENLIGNGVVLQSGFE
jgi:crotonobetainyl-CoA:carnitine CoA-transferase CaiB-like acyl-CoA transferase